MKKNDSWQRLKQNSDSWQRLKQIILLDNRVLAYEAKPKPKLGTVLNVWA